MLAQPSHRLAVNASFSAAKPCTASPAVPWPDERAPQMFCREDAFPVSLRTAYNARLLVAAGLWDWGLLPLVDEVLLVVSELVTNAVEHAKAAAPADTDNRVLVVRVRLWGSSLFVEVVDDGAACPAPGDACPNVGGPKERGRGLLIVGELADEWGISPGLGAGKTIWARFAVDGGRRALAG
jgi:anti-sigma regulatory factor (Ser/Thr protein kinase)